MSKKAVFAGLIFDEFDRPVEIAFVGQDPCYVVDDQGFRRHIISETVDRQVLDQMMEMVEGNEDAITDQTAKMLGQDDIFTRAMIANQIKQMDKQFDQLLQTGIPEDARAYMGMMGFKIIIDVHGNVINVFQPGMGIEGDED
ncbi:MAG: hypothetical protein CL609_13870 [Anaerolineaceae bacterium]|nr:hypothetical protein [Anaerolineaceae bacterium]